MEYKIITKQSLILLEKEIEIMIKKGWKPIGGVSVGQIISDEKIRSVDYFNKVTLYQSMIKEDDKKK